MSFLLKSSYYEEPLFLAVISQSALHPHPNKAKKEFQRSINPLTLCPQRLSHTNTGGQELQCHPQPCCCPMSGSLVAELCRQGKGWGGEYCWIPIATEKLVKEAINP